jgi:small conductance mechanosensitive channel
MNKSKKNKIFEYLEIVLIILVILAVLLASVIQLINPDSSFSKWCIDNVWNVKNTLASFKNHIPVLIDSIIYIVIIYSVSRLLRLIFKTKMKESDRTKTVYTLLDGFIRYGCAIAIILMLLKACGVDTAALVASVGVLTLIVGLGAQSLIADIIAGIFIIFENEYNVGEIISVDGFRGTVMEIGIRSTKVLDAAGNIKIINNSNIGDIVNLSRELSLAIIDLDFPYDVPVDVVENLLMRSFEQMKENISGIIEGPYYKGICDYKDSNVTLKIVAKCKEEDKFQIERDIRRAYRQILVDNNIDISYPQVVLNYPSEKEYKSTQETKKKANSFSNKQKKLSKDMEDQENN